MASEDHTIAELVEILKGKDQSAKVQYIVATPKGEVITINVSTQAKAMVKLLKMFGGS